MSTSLIGGASDTIRVPGNLEVGGTTTFSGATSGIARTELDQQNEAEYVLRPEDWRAFDDMDALLPSTLAGGSSGSMGSDDLHIDTPAYGSGAPVLKTVNAKKLGGITAKARRTWSLPVEYVAGQTVKVRVRAAMSGAVADQSATIDLSVRKHGEDGTVGDDLVTTAATAITATSFADFDFALSDTELAAGDDFDVLLSLYVNDVATEPTVIGVVAKVSALVDRK